MLELDCVTNTMGEENSSENYYDELFFTPTQENEELLDSEEQESVHVTPPCTQDNMTETNVKVVVLTTMEVNEVLVNEEIQEDVVTTFKEESDSFFPQSFMQRRMRQSFPHRPKKRSLQRWLRR